MGFRCGIVGLPNVGKSTFFNALTRSAVAAENYPFCTIDPNIGVVAVPDSRLAQIAALARPQKIVPTTIEFVDIAGLVEGASRGEGLGNQFLGHIRETDAIAHIVRCFTSDDVVHVAGRIDPVHDIELINTELMLADLDLLARAVERIGKRVKAGERDASRRLAVLQRSMHHLEAGRPMRTLTLSAEDSNLVADVPLLTAKPVMYVANVAESQLTIPDAIAGDGVEAVRRLAAEDGSRVVVASAAVEAELAQLDSAEQLEFLQALGLEEAGLDRVIREGYRLLSLLTFFTAGEKQVRAWTVSEGATAQQAGGKIHSDFERGFIRAEVIAFDDYLECGGEAGARERGRMRQEGRNYRVREGDIIRFRFNV